MKASRPIFVAAAIAVAVSMAACEREARRFATPAVNHSAKPDAPRNGVLQPGAVLAAPVRSPLRNESPYDGNAFAVNQGKKLYHWYYCSGCHSNGGGGIGPALMAGAWRYGSAPASVFASIMHGRPQGLPSFGGHIPEDQVWQIVAYVRSMSGLLRQDVAPSRADSINRGEPENARPPMAPYREEPPKPTPQGGS